MNRHNSRNRGGRATTLPGQLELALDVPELTDDQRAECAAYVLPGWQGMGVCRSVADDTWFPEHGHTATGQAVNLCADCPVRRSCLAHALAYDEDHGIWGGTTPVQRDVIRQDLAAGLAIADALQPPTLLAVA